MKYAGLVLVFLLLACADGAKDYDAALVCSRMGLKAGTAEYDECMREESTRAMMQNQREEFEQQKQFDRDWKLRRGY
jgi:hypothetical protein